MKSRILSLLWLFSTLPLVGRGTHINMGELEKSFVTDANYVLERLGKQDEDNFILYSPNAQGAKEEFKNMLPSKAVFDANNKLLAALSATNKKTIVFYSYKYFQRKKHTTATEVQDKIQQAMDGMISRLQSTDFNIITLITVWVDKPANKKTNKIEKLEEKTFVKVIPSQDIDMACVALLENEALKTLLEKKKADKTYKYYHDNALNTIVGLFHKKLPDCKDGAGKGIDLMLEVNGQKMFQGAQAAVISNIPTMPKIAFRIQKKEGVTTKCTYRFSIIYEHKYNYKGKIINRVCEFYDPAKDKTTAIEPSKDWKEIAFLADEMYGGKAKIELFKEDGKTLLKTLSFDVEGSNPSKAEISAYVSSKGYQNTYWFFSRIAKHESGANGGQFKSKGMPTFGYPDGWGMMQIDNYKDNTLNTDQLGYVWHWKKNVDKGYQVLEDKRKATVGDLKNETVDIAEIFKQDKDNVAPAADQVEGNNTFIHAPTAIVGFTAINKYFGDRTTDVINKSFIDANIIRRYNGGKYLFARTLVKNPKLGEWYIDNTRDSDNKSYVGLICIENE